MSKMIDTLMNEHRVIEQVLGSLKTFADGLEPGRDGSRERVADYARFFREFADRCHHGKEEERLFVRLQERGMPRDGGPLFIMLSEHEAGREHVRALTALGEGDGPLTVDECDAVRRHATEYVPLLEMHIQKEDGILFPYAETILSDEMLAELAVQFDEFEDQVMGGDVHRRLHALAEELVAAYPPAGHAETAAGGCFACGSSLR